MGSWSRVVGVAVVCTSLVLSGGPASAEWFADLFVGGAFTEKSEPTLKIPIGGVTTSITTKGLEHEDSVVFGGRGGYWLDAFPYVGFGLDASHFHADPSGGPKVDLGITVVGFDLMLRWPLMTSPAFPRGRLQPYAAVGPALFILEAKDFGNLGPSTQSDTTTKVGVKVAGGLTWLFTPNIGVFTEYRFLHFHPESTYDRSVDPITGATVSAHIHDSMSTHQVLAGVTFRF